VVEIAELLLVRGVPFRLLLLFSRVLSSSLASDARGVAPALWGGRELLAMAASPDRPGESYPEGPVPETSTRRIREQSQLDFEIEFLGRILERDPFFTDALRVHGNNLAARGLYSRALQVDRRLVRLMPERPIPWYNLACSYAVLGMIDPAFQALQRALELRYPRLDHVRRDPDLKTLRRDPRFARLLRRA
jgi:hypothetical protein